MMGYISPLPDAEFQTSWPRKLCILGATGSIGTSTLQVVRASNRELVPIALGGGRNIALLAEQATEFRPAYLGVQNPDDVPALAALLANRLPDYKPTIFVGQEGYEALASLNEADIIVSAQSGAAGLRATVAACKAGKVVALANKESLVIAGELIRKFCQETGAAILPVDSEHNAIFQCLSGNRLADVRRIVLTASGGPFFGKTREELARVTPAMALKHPNWVMGAKITIDSATLMNKGLEVIEAFHLYGLPLDHITVLVHRQSIVHSLVEYKDGSQLAQLGTPDMRTAISHCLNWPLRKDTGVTPLDLATSPPLTFAQPDEAAFPCLALAKMALQKGHGCPAVLNAANEVAVAAFLEGAIGFADIPQIIHTAMERVSLTPCVLELAQLLALDQEARSVAQSLVTR